MRKKLQYLNAVGAAADQTQRVPAGDFGKFEDPDKYGGKVVSHDYIESIKVKMYENPGQQYNAK